MIDRIIAKSTGTKCEFGQQHPGHECVKCSTMLQQPHSEFKLHSTAQKTDEPKVRFWGHGTFNPRLHLLNECSPTWTAMNKPSNPGSAVSELILFNFDQRMDNMRSHYCGLGQLT